MLFNGQHNDFIDLHIFLCTTDIGDIYLVEIDIFFNIFSVKSSIILKLKVQILEFSFCWPVSVETVRDGGDLSTYYRKPLVQLFHR